MKRTLKTCVVLAATVLWTQAASAQSPQITSPETNTTTSNTQPTLSGTAPAGAIVWVYDNNEPLGHTTATGSGTWEFTPDPPLATGLHKFTVDVHSGYWKLDEASGTTAGDSSGHNNSGTLTGNPAHSADIPSAVLFDDDNSLAFGGTSDYVLLNNPSSLDFSGQITIAAWVKRTGTGYHYVAGHTDFDNDPNVALYSNADTYAVGIFVDGVNHVASTGQYTQDRNVWVHLAGVYDGTTWRLYRNGEQVASTVDATGAVTVPTGNWAIGAPGLPVYGFMAGNLDDVRVYNRGLSANEVAALAAGKRAAAAASVDVTIAEAPIVSSIVRAGSNPTNDDTVTFTVTFSTAVTGVEDVDFTLTTTGNISGASVTGVSGSGNAYTVTVSTGSGDDGTIRLDVPVTATIEDEYDNGLVGLPFTTGQAYTIDKRRPTVTLVTSSVDNGTYQEGAYIPVTVRFSEPVAPTGMPWLVLATGGEGMQLGQTGGEGTDIVFDYYVVAGNGSADLNYMDTDSLTVTSGDILDAAGNIAYLTLPALDSETSLAGHKAIVINTAMTSGPEIALPTSGTLTNDSTPTFSGTGPYPGHIRIFHEMLQVEMLETDVYGDWSRELSDELPDGDHSFTVEASQGHWSLDAGSGTDESDSSGYGNSGTLANGAAPSADVPTVEFSNPRSVALDGLDDYVALGNPDALDFAGKITMAAWVKRSSNGYNVILAHTHNPTTNPNVAIYSNAGGYTVGTYDGANHVANVAGYEGDVNQWVHLAGVHDGTAWKLYRNGSLIATTVDTTGAVQVAGNWCIGAAGTGNYGFFQGNIDDVRIYNRALSANEIAKLAEGEPTATVWPTNITVDTTPPTVTINQAAGQDDPTDHTPILFAVEFSEPVVDFATGDVSLTGTAVAPGITSAEVTESGTNHTHYTVEVDDLSGAGTVTASISAGVAHDTAGNTNTASTSTDNTVTFAVAGPPPAPVIATPSKKTRDATPLVQGTAIPNATITVYFNGASDGTTNSNEEGVWSHTASAKAEGSYEVYARASVGLLESDNSNTIAVTVDLTPPNPPTNCRTIAYNNATDVLWDASPSGDVAGYNVYRKIGAGGNWELVNTTGMVLNTQYRDATAVNGQTYFYRVTAVDDSVAE